MADELTGRTWTGRRVLGGLAVSVLPVLAALWVGTTTFGGRPWPWRSTMVDLEVYRQAGSVLLAGGDFYALPGPLPFLYPPFAALLAVPLAVAPSTPVQVAWTAAGALCVLAMLHRFGLTGWRLSLVGAASIWFVTPVSQTLAFGQVGIVLVALVVLDLVPGPTVLPRRLLPRGAPTALAAAIKLTPAIFLGYLLVTRQWRTLVTAMLTGLVVTLAAALVLPRASLDFWGGLARGDTGLGGSIIYTANQSVMADAVRILGLGPVGTLIGLAGCAVVALAGVWVALLWHRLGEVGLAVNLCGVASLLASPVSWLHHFVWVVPLALSLALRRPGPASAGRALPGWFCVLGWLFVGWVATAPFLRLPAGGDVELLFTPLQNAVASITAVLGVLLLAAAIAVAQSLRLVGVRRSSNRHEGPAPLESGHSTTSDVAPAPAASVEGR